MSGLDLDALETKAAERVSAMADAEAANRAFEEARAACRAGGCFSVWGRSYTGDEAALNATLSTARDAKHAADVRALTAQVAWERAAPGEAADMVTALITRLRAAESALPSAAEVYAIEEARAAIESSCDVYCDEIDAWLSRVGEARAVQHGSEGLRAAEARTAWQPIETAPRDGTFILACGPGWDLADVAWYGQDLWWTSAGSYDQPTHWMPLPAAPEAGHG